MYFRNTHFIAVIFSPSGSFHNLKVPVSKPVSLHCHKTRPLLILGNAQDQGRLQFFSAQL